MKVVRGMPVKQRYARRYLSAIEWCAVKKLLLAAFLLVSIILGSSLTCTTLTSAYTDTSIARTGIDVNTSLPVTALHMAAPLPVAQGGTGTASPALVPGTNVTITGSWPNQTINSSSGGGGNLPSHPQSPTSVAGTGVVSQKPASTQDMQFVSVEGNDSNDGLSWGTAKATVFAALEALPGGSASPPTAGRGTVYISNSNIYAAVKANADSSCGVWIMGSQDPNYSSPPHCWLQLSGAFSIVCAGGSVAAGDDHLPRCGLKGGSEQTITIRPSGCPAPTKP